MAKATTRALSSAPPTVEELYFRSDSAYLCLVLNRRTKLVRVIDFRAGALPAKRLYIPSVAKQEGVIKVLTLVEKDEVSSWTRVGFVREGTIPGFYKRSDGHLCGCVIGDKTASIACSDADVRLAERTIHAAKKRAREDFAGVAKDPILRDVDAATAEAARDAAWAEGLAVGTFDRFERDAERAYFDAPARRGEPNYLSTEYQDCFGHSLIEVLRSPADDATLVATIAGLEQLGESLMNRGIVSAFAFAPSDDVPLGTAFTAAGYRRTGLLAQGIVVGEERKDAILWTRKLANPAADSDDEEEEEEEEE